MPVTFSVVAVMVSSYLLGAIPVAYLIARFNSVNIFEVGSGNMGTTNVIRAVGPVMGVMVLVLDALKGVGAIWLASGLLLKNAPETATVIAAIFAIAGHNWSVFAWMVTGKLRGGKGAATAFGTFVVIAPWWLIVGSVVIGVLVLVRTRYMSLGVLVIVSVAAPGLALLSLVDIPAESVERVHLFYTLGLTSMILYRFRGNIARLRAGNERRVGESA